MSVHGDPEDDVTFVRDGKLIYLRCVDDQGQHMGDLRIAEAVLDAHAHTLVNAANAGMQLFRRANVEAGLRQILDGDTP
jgi:hypothetical protein